MPQTQPLVTRGGVLNNPFRRAQSSTKQSKSKTATAPEKDHGSFSIDHSDRRPSTMDIFTSKEKRKSLGMALPGRSNSPARGSAKGSPKITPAKPAKLIVDMESPPLVFYGNPTQSSGALLSGQLLLTVTDPEVRLQSFEMDLLARITTKKPVHKDCPECSSHTTTLFHWKFLTEPNRFKRGTHTFPFSYLLPGHLPATSHTALGMIDYALSSTASTSESDTISVTRTLTIQRALMPTIDKNHIRIFPPTNLTATVVLPSQIYPIGEFPVQMRLSGIIDTSLKDIQRRWRIRRVNWRIDEHSKIISAACHKHAHKVGGEGKGILHEETRAIGSNDLKSGWKTDFDTPGGQIEFEFNAAIKPNLKPVCDVESPTGLASSHYLVLEVIVAEEQTAAKSAKYATPTGAARILRMQFKLLVTERSGMGVSWDEEMPPMYEDVPNSPPGYHRMEDWEGDLGPDEELEGMRNA